ncbi:transglycosylase SLT domain-containing protein [Kocuria sp. ZOR0020]|uniref:transglycosylase SLT domain-containing protein n=1 Tax=Kocuria sp. ZOR0020 TaxID=1339234 RepID=UPI000AAEAA42|nr:transglycosylase SLT domain-containing protein [Kocuria sp. ZOR0020]
MNVVKKAGAAAVVKWVGPPVAGVGFFLVVVMVVFALLMTLMTAGASSAKDAADTQAAAANAASSCRVDAANSGGGTGLPQVEVPSEFVGPIEDAAKATGLPKEIIAAQIQAESGFKTSAASSVGAIGPAQFMPGTWAEWGNGGDPRDPADSLAAYARYMKHLLDLASGWAVDGGPDAPRLAVAAYNAGPGTPGLRQGQLPPYEETQGYVSRIFGEAQVSFSADCAAVDLPSDVELGDGEWANPLPGGRFTSGYGYRNLISGCAPDDMSLANGCFANHHLGVDFATGGGSGPGGVVVAPTDAEVVCVPGDAFDGMVQLKVSNGKDSPMLINFFHTDSQMVSVGDKVKRGDPVAIEGNKGFSTGTHLHMEIMKPGTPACKKPGEVDAAGRSYNVNPEPIMRQKGIL